MDMRFRFTWKWNSRLRLGDLSQALTGEHVTVTRQTEDSPSNVNAAGQANILVSSDAR